MKIVVYERLAAHYNEFNDQHRSSTAEDTIMKHYRVRVTQPSGASATYIRKVDHAITSVDVLTDALTSPDSKVEVLLLGEGEPTCRVLGCFRAFHTVAQAESYVRGLSEGYHHGHEPLDSFQDLGAADEEAKVVARQEAQQEAYDNRFSCED